MQEEEAVAQRLAELEEQVEVVLTRPAMGQPIRAVAELPAITEQMEVPEGQA